LGPGRGSLKTTGDGGKTAQIKKCLEKGPNRGKTEQLPRVWKKRRQNVEKKKR